MCMWRGRAREGLGGLEIVAENTPLIPIAMIRKNLRNSSKSKKLIGLRALYSNPSDNHGLMRRAHLVWAHRRSGLSGEYRVA